MLHAQKRTIECDELNSNTAFEPLAKKRRTSSGGISASDSPCRPFDKLPAEIITKVFVWLLTGLGDVWGDVDEITRIQRNLSDQTCQLVTTLSNVCQFWRAIVRNTTELWSRVDMTSPEYAADCLRCCGGGRDIHIRGRIVCYYNGRALNMQPWCTLLGDRWLQITTIALLGAEDSAIQEFLDVLQHVAPMGPLIRLASMRLVSGEGVGLQCIVVSALRFRTLQSLSLTDIVLDIEDTKNPSFPLLRRLDVDLTVVSRNIINSLVKLLALTPFLRLLCIDCRKARTVEANLDDHLRDMAAGDRVQLRTLEILEILGLNGTTTAGLCDVLQAGKLAAGYFTLLSSAEVSDLLASPESDDSLVRRFQRCECKLRLLHSVKHTSRLTLEALAPPGCPDPCYCSTFVASVMPIGYVGEIVHFLHVLVDSRAVTPITTRISDFTISLHAMKPRLLLSFETCVRHWKILFGLLPGLERLVIEDARMSSRAVEAMTHALKSSRLLVPKLSSVEVQLVYDTTATYNDRIVDACGKIWRELVEAREEIYCCDVKVPEHIDLIASCREENQKISELLDARGTTGSHSLRTNGSEPL
ncbi:hypothetical protein EIP91_002418 [Steccherinum ochraceum]|uniref:Uncharacterized protein n=1 Tax=Steccherinum ochraceum TaxID=92696 RepID=A0A4R0RC87_9APHY|nr:hypothetical protein EIP91_002418 [Steccherinum ochraceum]